MGATHSGYVNSGDYRRNSDGTFRCKLNTLSNSADPSTVITKDISCIGILNVNNLVSPNRPNQALVMSSDDKYIFISTTINTSTNCATNAPSCSSPSASNNSIIINDYLVLYITNYAFVNYSIGIPDSQNLSVFTHVLAGWQNPYDSTLNGLSGTNKVFYKGYLMGQNPPASLLAASTKKIWSDIGYIYKSFYDANPSNNESVAVPETYCAKIDSPNVIPFVSQYDCRSNPKASPVLYNVASVLTSLGSGFSGMMLLICCCCISCISIFVMFLGTMKSKK